MCSSIPTQIHKLNLRNHLMNLETSEELITAEIQVSGTGQYFRPLLHMAKLLKKKSEKFRNSLTFSNYTHLPSIILLQLDNLWKGNAFSSVYYNIDQSWNRVVYGTIYADQLMKKLILPNFTKNLSGTWKRDLKPCSRKVQTKMSMIQFSEKLKKKNFPTRTISCKSSCHHYFHTLLIPSEGFT